MSRGGAFVGNPDQRLDAGGLSGNAAEVRKELHQCLPVTTKRDRNQLPAISRKMTLEHGTKVPSRFGRQFDQVRSCRHLKQVQPRGSSHGHRLAIGREVADLRWTIAAFQTAEPLTRVGIAQAALARRTKFQHETIVRCKAGKLRSRPEVAGLASSQVKQQAAGLASNCQARRVAAEAQRRAP